MSKKFRWGLKICWFLALCNIGVSYVSACTLTMRVTDHAPYFIKVNQQWRGIDVEQSKALAKRINCRLVYKPSPWARGVEMVKNGKVDFITNVSKTESRQKYFHFVGPHRVESIRLVSYRKSFRPVSTWHQFMQLNVTLMRQRGGYFGEQFEDSLRRNYLLRRQMVETVGQDIRLDLLAKKRVDAFIADQLYVDYILQRQPQAEGLFIHPLIIHQNPVYFAFSKVSIDTSKLLKIEKAMNELRISQTFEKILNAY